MKNYIWLLVGVFIIVGLCEIQIFAQEKVSLKEKRITIHRENQSLVNIFRDLIERYDIAIGFEESSLDANHSDYEFDVNLPNENCFLVINNTKTKCKPEFDEAKDHKFTISVENEPLENVLNQIISKMKHYKWEINDEVVNIFPIEGREKRLENLLNVKIKNFTLRTFAVPKKVKKIIDILPSITTTFEIVEFCENNNLVFNISRPNIMAEKPIEGDLNFSNLTLKDLLNKITKHNRGGWRLKLTDYSQNSRHDVIRLEI